MKDIKNVLNKTKPLSETDPVFHSMVQIFKQLFITHPEVNPKDLHSAIDRAYEQRHEDLRSKTKKN